MHKNTIAFVIVAAIGGFIGGFWLANSLNRSAINMGATPNVQPVAANSNSSPAMGETDLSSDEIRAKIAEADKNAANFGFQKDLGVALYRYAAMKQDVNLLAESARILERGNSLNAKDFDVLVALGNAHFDIGFYNKDATSFQKARDAYSKALDIKPGDPDVQTDRGLTYFLQAPPAYDQAASELNKVSASNPKHERSLQFLVQVLIRQNKLTEAERVLARIKTINPSNASIAELTSEIAAAQGGAGK